LGLVVADDSAYQTEEYNSSDVVLDVTLISHAVGDKVESSGQNPATFQFFIDTEAASPATGLTQMYAKVDVYALDDNSDPISTNGPIPWVLQSGVDNTAFDTISTGSDGALFLLDLVAGQSMPNFDIPMPPTIE